ncbi:serine/threonine protein kinase [Rivularia sp. PCC 7116]|uniref:serine/threonine protein kinase n=1 Tax=Rivularia sp. PCC 7116 TaxID=373994 RepID=UPI00029EDE45|nr:serine/threonine-protein kinase [Rivularia sp. PCC 7116]AFY52688.1 serine/threonine protein kinase [Rivularia sp. PCC 7116]
MKSEILGSRYSIREQLGKKPGRYTYLALDEATHDLVVVKLLKFDRDFEWDSLKLFEREAEILRNLSHPFIPQYLDYFEVDSAETKGFALVQSYIDAKSLEEQVKTGRTFNEAELKEIAEKLLNILIHLHQLKPAIVHRDIKPSNILLTNRSGNSVGEVYLVDFGSVQNITVVENTTLTVVGTYGYMSPEHFGGRAVPTSDLYSLGATLLYLATGIHPADFPQKDLQIQFEDKTQLSPHFTSWLKKVLEPSREKRFNSAEMALAALQKPEIISQNIDNNLGIKPVDTKIHLHQNADNIEIIKPSRGWTFSSIEKLITNTFSTVIGLVCIMFLWHIPLIGWLISVMIAWLGVLNWIDFIFEIFGTTQLVINQKVIFLSYQLFGIKYEKVRPSARKNIIKLEYTNSFIKEAKKSNGKISYKEVSPTIIVWAGNKQYKLTGITQTEVEWLLKELSNSLKLPFQRRVIPIIQSD